MLDTVSGCKSILQNRWTMRNSLLTCHLPMCFELKLYDLSSFAREPFYEVHKVWCYVIGILFQPVKGELADVEERHSRHTAKYRLEVLNWRILQGIIFPEHFVLG